MQHNCSIRTYQKGDEKGIFELWRDVYPSKRLIWEEWIGWWEWMYKQNSAGEGLIWLAESDGHIVAHHALVPLGLKIGEETVIGSWGADAMTHPDFRRKGLFEAISKELWAEAARKGIHINPGFPNENSRPGLIKKLGWFEISRSTVMYKPLNWKKVLRLKVKNRVLSSVLAAAASFIVDKVLFRTHKSRAKDNNWTITQIEHFDERFERFWARISIQYTIMVTRSRDFLNWRFSHPGAEYTMLALEEGTEVRGYIVLGNERLVDDTRSILIFDLVAESEEYMIGLIQEAIRECKKKGIDYIAYGFIADNSYHRALKKSGFIHLPFIKGGPFCVRCSNADISKEFLQNSDNWLYQLADTDIVWEL